MRPAVEEAHKAGRKAAAHAYSVEAINNALEAGVDSVEHGSFLDRETMERMREQGTYLVPTMSVYAAMAEKGPSLGSPEYITRKTAEVLEASGEAFRLALEAGVPVAAGTDCGAPGHRHGTLPEELRLMVEAGATRRRRCASARPRLRSSWGWAMRWAPWSRASGLTCSRSPATRPWTSRPCVKMWLVLRDGAEVNQ